MLGIGAALAIGAGLKAAGGIASGIGTARAGKKMELTEAEKKELAALEKRQKAGELGLTERERGAIEARFAASQAGAQRALEAQGLQAATARGASGAVSGRELFLSELAREQAARGMAQEQNIAVEEANRAEREAERARIDAMRAQQKQAEATRSQGIAQAVSLGLAGAGEGATQYGVMQQEAKMREIEANARARQTQDLLRQYQTQPSRYSFNFGGSYAAP